MKRILWALVAAWLPLAAWSQAASPGATVLRADTLRVEPFADARPVAELPAGARLQLLERKGTWANAEYQGRRGWLRALNLRAEGAAALRTEGVLALQTGRAAQGGVAVPLAVRSGRPPRHALQLLDEVFERRDASRALNATGGYSAAGEIELSLDSPRAGHAQVFAVDAAGRVLRCLFPNANQPEDDIAAGRVLSLTLPRPDPADRGAIRLLAVVSDAPPDLVFEDKEPDGAYFRVAVTEDGRARIGQALAGALGNGRFAARSLTLPAAK